MSNVDAFGRLCVDPDRLSQRERVDVVRRLAGELQASPSRDVAWLGRKLTQCLHEGTDLAILLGLRPPKGSKRTARAILQLEQRDRLLMQLSVAAGGDRAALRILDGQADPRPSMRGIVAEVRALGAPRSVAAFSRARARCTSSAMTCRHVLYGAPQRDSSP